MDDVRSQPRRGRGTALPFALVLLGLTAAAPARLVAAEPSDPVLLAAELSQPILPPGLVDDELRGWCDARVAVMPPLETPAQWREFAERTRQLVLERVVLRGAPVAWREGTPRVVSEDWQTDGVGYRWRKLRYEALPGLWIPAILYEPREAAGRLPVALHVNGHDADGKAARYKQIRSINLAKRGILTLNVEWLGMGQLRSPGFAHGRMNQLELCGTAGLAPFYLAMQRGLDVVLSHERADAQRVAVSGLSGGGWQTIYLSALDPRVTLANPVAGYSSFKTRLRHSSDLGDSEQTPTDMATIADYTHFTAMRAPRPTLLTYNAKDNCCFASAHALPPLLESARPVFSLLEAGERLRHHVNEDPGTHNFERENREAYYVMLADFLAPPGVQWPKSEIDCDAEIRTAAQLAIDLPADNADFPSLARGLAVGLPRGAEVPVEGADLRSWRASRREQLAQILRTPVLPHLAAAAGTGNLGDIRINRWRLRVGESWTLPLVEFVPVRPTGTWIVLADAGRKSAGALVARHLAQGHRVIAVDPFYLGESAYSQRPYLNALLVATVGDRPLGLQARQLQAVAQWAAGAAAAADSQPAAVSIAAVGPRASLAALVAVALADQPFGQAELHDSLGSLHEVLEKSWSFEQAPECFCFGLLGQFDIRSLVELAAPREVQFVEASPRVQRELAPTEAWYRRLGKSFSPVSSAKVSQ